MSGILCGPLENELKAALLPYLFQAICAAFKASQEIAAAGNELPRRLRRGIKSFLGKRIAASREVSDPVWKNEVLDGVSKKAIADAVYDMLPAEVGGIPMGMTKLFVSRARFEELVQAAYDKFDENFHAWQDDLAIEFERWKQLQTQPA